MSLPPLLRRLFCAAITLLAAGAAAGERHYEYLLLLRGAPTPAETLQRAQAALSAPLRQHRLVDAATLRAWDGRGLPPLALETRQLEGQTVDELEIGETGEPVRQLLRRPRPAPVAALALMVGVPAERDLPAYLEALRVGATLARALTAPAFIDVETGGDARLSRRFAERLHEGVAGSAQPVSADNPPPLSIMDGLTNFEPHGPDGLRTRGLRRLGLPDLLIDDWIPTAPPFWLLQGVGGLLTAGRLPAQAGQRVPLRGDDKLLERLLFGGLRPGARAELELAAAGPRLLRIELPPGEAGRHPYEQQALLMETVFRSRYPGLPAEQALGLVQAVARSKAGLRDLRARFAALRAEGSRVFISTRFDLLVAESLKSGKPASPIWEEVIGWSGNRLLELRRWEGDPRSGGQPLRYRPPLQVGDKRYEYSESSFEDHGVDDWLLIDRQGRVQGGEATRWLQRLFDTKARPAP